MTEEKSFLVAFKPCGCGVASAVIAFCSPADIRKFYRKYIGAVIKGCTGAEMQAAMQMDCHHGSLAEQVPWLSK